MRFRQGPHNFKRGMKGTYQHCGRQHLQRYTAEFAFRYSNRIAAGFDDQDDRAHLALVGIKGKRLTYQRSFQAYIQASGCD